MHRTVVVSLAVGVLALAGCGGASKAPTTAATTAPLPPGVSRSGPPPVTSATYTLNLIPTPGIPPHEPAGEPNASGLATISINPSTHQLCWIFAQLKNITTPAMARLYVYTPGGTYRRGLKLGSPFSPGCVPLEPVVLGLIERKPQLYIITIDNARFPAGAVRAPL